MGIKIYLCVFQHPLSKLPSLNGTVNFNVIFLDVAALNLTVSEGSIFIFSLFS